MLNKCKALLNKAFSFDTFDQMKSKAREFYKEIDKGIDKPKPRGKAGFGDEIDNLNDKIKSLFDTWNKKKLDCYSRYPCRDLMN